MQSVSMNRQTTSPHTIIAVLGGPGSGKGTQCQHLSRAFNIHHISIGDMLREEMQDPTSPYAELLKANMLAGRLGPPEMTVQILKAKFERFPKGKVVVLDGFPRAIKPYQHFEEHVAPTRRIVVLDVAEEVLVRRLKSRARFDDVAGAANIAERMRTYREDTAEVLRAAEAEQKLVRVNGDREVDAVAADMKAALEGLINSTKTV